MYRKTAKFIKQHQKMANMRAAKARIRLEGEPPEYPVELPYLRRKIIIVDYDHGVEVHRLDLFRSNRSKKVDAAHSITWFIIMIFQLGPPPPDDLCLAA